MCDLWPKPGHKPYLTKQKERELTDHLVLAAKVGYGKTPLDIMNMMEIYINSQPNEIEAQKTAADSRHSEIGDCNCQQVLSNWRLKSYDHQQWMVIQT